MKLVRSRSLMVAAAVVGAVGASASMVASASAGGLPIQRVTYQGLQANIPGASKETSVVGGAKLGIRVVPHGKQPKSRATARVTVTRTVPGKKTETLVRKSLRKGSVYFPLATAVGVRYRLQVQIGKRHWTTRLRTVETDPGSGSGPSSTPCSPAGTITADAPTAVAGGTLPFHITNTGNAPLTYGSGNGWTQLVGETWTNVLSPGGLGPATTSTIFPGQTQTGKGAVWSTLTPGTYSMTVVATCATTNPNGSATFKAIPLQTAPITVTAAAGR
jgi:hypothetical protein